MKDLFEYRRQRDIDMSEVHEAVGLYMSTSIRSCGRENPSMNYREMSKKQMQKVNGKNIRGGGGIRQQTEKMRKAISKYHKRDKGGLK